MMDAKRLGPKHEHNNFTILWLFVIIVVDYY